MRVEAGKSGNIVVLDVVEVDITRGFVAVIFTD